MGPDFYSVIPDIVRKILLDITNRKGLGDAFDDIDFRTKREIKDAWANIIKDEYQKTL